MMNKSFLFCLIVGLLFSCQKDDEPEQSSNTELIGQWKLFEVYADPGDGSGDFEPVSSEKIIFFHVDGTITSNGDLCTMSIEADNPTSGNYSLVDSTFNSQDCISNYNYQFDQNGNILIIYYPCIEPCQTKYQKEQ